MYLVSPASRTYCLEHYRCGITKDLINNKTGPTQERMAHRSLTQRSTGSLQCISVQSSVYNLTTRGGIDGYIDDLLASASHGTIVVVLARAVIHCVGHLLAVHLCNCHLVIQQTEQ